MSIIQIFVCLLGGGICLLFLFLLISNIIYKQRDYRYFNSFGYTITKKASGIIIDDNSNMWMLVTGFGDKRKIYSLDDIGKVTFNTWDTYGSATKKKGGNGVGRAVVGGALFGPAGAVVGAVTAKPKTTTTTYHKNGTNTTVTVFLKDGTEAAAIIFGSKNKAMDFANIMTAYVK